MGGWVGGGNSIHFQYYIIGPTTGILETNLCGYNARLRTTVRNVMRLFYDTLNATIFASVTSQFRELNSQKP